MPTLVGARRRGFTPEGFRLFAERIGVSKSDSWIDMSVLEDAMRDDLNAQRRAAHRGARSDQARHRQLSRRRKPKIASRRIIRSSRSWGARAMPLSRELWIERDDFAETPPKGYFRLSPGAEVRLRYALHRALHRRREGRRRQRDRRPLHVRSRPRAAARRAPTRARSRATSTGCRRRTPVPAEVRLYDRLFRRAVSRRARSAVDERAAAGGGAARPRMRSALAGEDDDGRRRARAQFPRRSQPGVEAHHHRVRRAGARATPRRRIASSSSATAISSPTSSITARDGRCSTAR